MMMTTDMLFLLLSGRYQAERLGRRLGETELSLPTLWKRGDEVKPGGVYIAHTDDLPKRPAEECVFVCFGTKPPKTWNAWRCEVIYVPDADGGSVDILNTVQDALTRLFSWREHMHGLLVSNAHVRDMVEETIPILENRITVCDFDFNILAACELDEERPEEGVRLSSRLERVPASGIPAMLESRASLIRNREPYFYDAPEGRETYCINLFVGETYIGSCSLQEAVRPLTPLDFELFQVFASFVRDALAVQTRNAGGQIVISRTIFGQLLNGYPVSQTDMSHAIRLMELNMGDCDIAEYRWCCAAIQNSHRDRTLPESYLIDTVESILPNATALSFEGSIVVFLLVGKADDVVDVVCRPLETFLSDMGLHAGISRTFLDPFRARYYYRQAICAIMTGTERNPGCCWYLFEQYALDYALSNCCGDFDTRLMVPPELVRLYQANSPDVDYVATLRAFLDNDRRVTQTSKELFLHRSTLMKRLEKIERYVDLDDPDRRLFLRLCLHLPDIYEALENSSDVS